MSRRRVLAVLLTTAMCFVTNPSSTAAESSAADDRRVNVASTAHSSQKWDRLEAIRHYILERLNVSDNRRFNRSAPPPTMTTPPSICDHQRSHRPLQPTSFGSVSDALNYYYAQLPRNGGERSQRENGARRRRRRLQSCVDEADGTGLNEHGPSSSRRPSSQKRGQRRQIKLRMTADTGQNLPPVCIQKSLSNNSA